MELFTYDHPKGDQDIHIRKTNDLGGIRHVAVEVPDAVEAYEFIRCQQLAYGETRPPHRDPGAGHAPEQITPFPTSSSTGLIPGACSGRWSRAGRSTVR